MIAPRDFSAPRPMEAEPSAALVRRFLAGDETAFVEIAARYRPRLFAAALAMLGSRSDAEEVAQDALIRAHRALKGFRGDASLATWLHHIALNLARNRYWHNYRRQRHVTQSLDCPVGGDSRATWSDLIATSAACPARAAIAGEFTELVGACLDQLCPRDREILTLRCLLHHPYGNIAQELSISLGTVKSRITRAREKLRILLAAACPESAGAAWFETVHPAGRLVIADG